MGVHRCVVVVRYCSGHTSSITFRMMKIAVLVAVLMVGGGAALKCYTCSDCGQYSVFTYAHHEETECTGITDTCVKLVAPDETIEKRCGVIAVCNAHQVADGLTE